MITLRYQVIYWETNGEDYSHTPRFDTLIEAMADIKAEFAEIGHKLCNRWIIFDDLVDEQITQGRVDMNTGDLIIEKIWVIKEEKDG